MTLDFKGSKIFYSDKGKGKPLVFLHGFLEDSTMWDFIVQELSNKYRCISIDFYGHGKSDGADGIYTMIRLGEKVLEILEYLEIDEFTIFGHSMGGYVALAIAEIFPNRLEGICLINSTALEDDKERRKNRDRAMALLANDKRIFISMAISNLFQEKNLTIYNKEINEIKRSAYQIPIKAINASMMGMKLRPNRVEVLKSLKCKKLVVLGSSDSILPLKTQRKYLKTINSNFMVLEGGHMLHIENKYEITYIIKHFIE